MSSPAGTTGIDHLRSPAGRPEADQPVITTAAHKIPKIQPPRTSVVQCTPRYTREMPTSTASIAAMAQTAVRARHEASRSVHSQATTAHTAAAAAACPDGKP